MMDSKALMLMTDEALDDFAVRICEEARDPDIKLTATKIKEIRDSLLALRDIAERREYSEKANSPLDVDTAALAPFPLTVSD